MGYSCTFDDTLLYCASGSIRIESAVYGHYATECQASTSCCQVDQNNDCTESIEDNFPVDWDDLRSKCDGQTSCSVENLGRAMLCNGQAVGSNYAMVLYNCSEGKYLVL